MGGPLLAQHLFQSVDKPEYRRRVEAVAGQARHLYEGIVGAEYQRIRIKEKQAFFIHVN